jgi:drug/metabolite transporter (DMT)-like permease
MGLTAEEARPAVGTPAVGTSSGRSGVVLVLLAVLMFSTSPVFVLGAAPLSPFEITVGRLAVAALVVWTLGRINRQRFMAERRDLPLFALFGLITAVHFLSYIASLNYTTIAHSLAIVYTAPIFVTLFSVLFLKESASGRKWLGVLVTVAGIAIMTGLEPRMNRRMAFGDLLALGAAVTYALYSIAGRSQRERYGLFTYAGTVYGIAALFALPAAALSFTPVGVTPRSWLAVFLAGLLPLGMGHTLYNAALRRTHATVVSLIATQEVTGGVILGMLFFSQMPQPNEIAGAAVALIGIALVLI